MAKVKMKSTILQQECIGTDIYSLWLDAPEIASQAKPGQFISVYSNDSGRVLPRPISICEIDRAWRTCLPSPCRLSQTDDRGNFGQIG